MVKKQGLTLDGWNPVFYIITDSVTFVKKNVTLRTNVCLTYCTLRTFVSFYSITKNIVCQEKMSHLKQMFYLFIFSKISLLYL